MDQTPQRDVPILDASTNTSGIISNTSNTLPLSVNGVFSSKAWNFYNTDAYIEVAENSITQSFGDTQNTNGLSISLWVNYQYDKNLFDRLAGLESVFDILVTCWMGLGTK